MRRAASGQVGSPAPTPGTVRGLYVFRLVLWLQVSCVATVLDALTRDEAQPGKQTSRARKKFSGAPAWTVVTAA
jgi:hypothetical protein